MKSFCPICFILPNSIAREIAKNAPNPEDRDLALHQISRNSRIREKRSLLNSGDFIAAAPVEKDVQRLIYSAKHSSDLPGYSITTQAIKKTKDPGPYDAYRTSGIVLDFLSQVLGRNSFDDEGGNLIATVHYQERYDNAFWDGIQMVYGDGDGKYFNSFTNDLEITGHELFHAVTAATAGLDYSGESGALNESYSDVFGSMIKQWKLKQKVEDADWIIGKGLFTKLVKGVGIRKLDAPGTAYDDPVIGKDNTRGNYKNLYKGSSDDGGVHLNSGIPSLAFVTAAKLIGGYSWEKLGVVWYRTLLYLNSNANFKTAATATIKMAESEFSEDRSIAESIRSGWQQVGVI